MTTEARVCWKVWRPLRVLSAESFDLARYIVPHFDPRGDGSAGARG